jgi:hypothetical protein
MAVKTFTTETLTSADTNTYLANSGLVYVTSGTVSGTPSSITVSSAFSSTYDHYQILVSNMTVTNSANLRMTFGSTVTGYYYGNPLTAMVGGAYDKTNGSNVAYIDLGNVLTTWDNDFNFQVFAPNKATATKVHGFGYTNNNSYGGLGSGIQTSLTSHTAFTLTLSTGAMSAGTVSVFGWRKP